MRIKGFEKYKRIYFIGIGGVSMGALAKLLKVSGYFVSGSDRENSERLQDLAESGIGVYIGEDNTRKDLLLSDCVIYTHAISNDNIELKEAKHLKKIIYDRGELLALICSQFPYSISVAGSHGKTTCTSPSARASSAGTRSWTTSTLLRMRAF